ncbi:MAG: TIGR00153 family protein [Gammaproteobacteria bacterium]|nr:MAG: TIGR00153 family protein [Gammaproteobacteria bacterium]
MAFSSPLSVLFARSPIQPMQDHIQKVYECTMKLKPFMEAVFAENWDRVLELQQEISSIENDADDMKRNIRMNLPKGLFMAIDRRDLLDLLSRQDRIANKAKDIAGVITGRSLVFPTSLHGDITIYLDRCIEACKFALKSINELDELVTAGFKGQERLLVEQLVDELDKIENDTDKQQIQLRAKLLKIEKEYSPIDVMFMYETIDWMGGIADNAQLVGDRLELMVAR